MEPEESKSNTGLILTLGITLGLILAGYYLLYQFHYVYEPSMQNLFQVKERCVADVNKAETLRARQREFEAEIARLEEEWEGLRKQIPETTDAPVFVKGLIAFLESNRIPVDRHSIKELPFAEYAKQAEVTIFLKRPIETLEAQYPSERFVLWEDVGGSELKLRIFAMQTKRAAEEHPFPEIENRVPLWPFSNRYKVLRKDVDDWLERRAKLTDAMAKVNRLESMRFNVVMLREIRDAALTMAAMKS